jgi:hypothetical protein
MLGAALLAAVVAKLFLVDLSALSGLPRVVAFLGVGLLLLVIGFVSPLPPRRVRGPENRRQPPCAGVCPATGQSRPRSGDSAGGTTPLGPRSTKSARSDSAVSADC